MPIKIFFWYAHEDEKLLEKLKAHLEPLQQQKLVDFLPDITAGTTWKQAINERLDQAQIILLLVSPDFIKAEDCYSDEMQQAIKRHREGKALVFPVILRPAAWKNTPLCVLSPLPLNGKPVIDSSWQTPDHALLNVVKELQSVIAKPAASSLSLPPIAGNFPRSPALARKMIVFAGLALVVVIASSVAMLSLPFHLGRISSLFPTSQTGTKGTVQTSTTSNISPTASSDSIKWRTLLPPFAPLCNDAPGTSWKLISGDAHCEQSMLSMQQTSIIFAELDLKQIEGKPFEQATFRVQVTVTFQDPKDANNGSLFVQMPATNNGIGGYIVQVGPNGVLRLLHIIGQKNAYPGGTESVRNENYGPSLQKQVTVIVMVQDGILSAAVKGYHNDQPLFNQPLNSTPSKPSPIAFGLMVCSDSGSSAPSSLISFSNLELDVPA